MIDDSVGHTLAALSTISKSMKEKIEGSVSANKEGATAVGKQLAELCLSKNIKTVFFDRGGLQYHGRVQVWLSVPGLPTSLRDTMSGMRVLTKSRVLQDCTTIARKRNVLKRRLMRSSLAPFSYPWLYFMGSRCGAKLE